MLMDAERRMMAVAPASDMPYGYDPRQLTLLDRLAAASAHLAILLSLPGLIYAAVLWFTLRRRAPFISRHARQAVLWQIATNIALLFLLLLLFVIALLSFGTTLGSSGSIASTGIVGLFGSLLGFFVALILGLAVAVGAAIIGAIYALAGRPFRYPIFNLRRR